MKVLSLFDGISGAQIALNNLSVVINCYYASEIDNKAISVTQYHFPETIQVGDVKSFRCLDSVDLLIAGFPCQPFSKAGKKRGFDDERGQLFFEVIRHLKESKATNFLLENVVMNKDNATVIRNALENAYEGRVYYTELNSSLVSAQERLRGYWSSFAITQPIDSGIAIQDILEDSNYAKWNEIKNYSKGTMSRANRNTRDLKDKAVTLCTGSRSVGANGATVIQKDGKLRVLSVLEQERLQTFPDNYTKVPKVSKSQRTKFLGNSFTVKVIEHILSQVL